MDYCFYQKFEQLLKDVAEIKSDIVIMKDQQAQLNSLYDKSVAVEGKARGMVEAHPPAG